MSRCRVCPTPPENSTRSGPTTALLLRVWRESDGVRGRLIPVDDPATEPASGPATRVAHGEDDICAAVRVWLEGI